MRASGKIGAALLPLAIIAAAHGDPAAPSAAAEAALADGLPSLAGFIAAGELAGAAAPAEKDRIFAVLAESREKSLPQKDFARWLREQGDMAALPSHRYFTARAAILDGRYGEALELLEKLGDDVPADSYLALPVQINRAVALDRCGRRRDAEALLGSESAKRGIPALSKMHIQIAGGDFASASNTLDEIRSDKGSDPDIAAHGEVLLARAIGDETALTNALASLAGRSKAIARTRERVALRISARNADASAALAAARRIASGGTGDADDAAAIRDAASLLSDAGLPDAAAELSELYLASFPTTADEAFMNCLLGRALEAREDFSAAAAAYTRAAEFDGSGERHRLALKAAEMQFKAGMPNQALATLASPAFAQAPEELLAPAAFLSAECEAGLDPACAVAAYRSVAERFPGTEHAEIALRRISRLETGALMESSETETSSAREPGGIPLAAAPEGESAPGGESVRETGGRPDALAGTAGGDDSRETSNETYERAENSLDSAVRMQREGRFAAACNYIVEVLNNPDAGDLKERAAAMYPQALDALGRGDEALNAFEAFTKEFKSSVYLNDVKFWRAAHAFNTADWPLACAMFEEFAGAAPDSARAPYALLYAASAALRAGNFGKTVELADRLDSADGDFEHLDRALFAKAEALCRLLRFADAEGEFRRIVKSDSARADVRTRAALRLGDCIFSLSADDPERIEESAECYRMVLRIIGENGDGALRAECNYKLGRTLARTGKNAEAVRAFYERTYLPYRDSPAKDALPWAVRALKDAAALSDELGYGEDAASFMNLLKQIEPGQP